MQINIIEKKINFNNKIILENFMAQLVLIDF